MFDSLNPTMKLCMRYVSPTTDTDKHPMLSVSYIRESESEFVIVVIAFTYFLSFTSSPC